MIYHKEIVPDKTDFTVAIFKIPQISKHFSAMLLTLRYVGPFEKKIVLTTEIEWLKPNRQFSELVIQEVTVSMVTNLPFFLLISACYLLSVLSAKLYFLGIGPVHQKLWSFKCTILKTLISSFLEWEDTLMSMKNRMRVIPHLIPERTLKNLEFGINLVLVFPAMKII